MWGTGLAYNHSFRDKTALSRQEDKVSKKLETSGHKTTSGLLSHIYLRLAHSGTAFPILIFCFIFLIIS